MNRYFVRCGDCLSVIAVECAYAPTDLACACGGRYWLLGKLKWGRHLVKSEWGCPCDGRCTGARGPNCSCKCGGENHGTGRVVEIEVYAGKPPRVTPPDAAAIARGESWRSELSAVRELLRRAWPAYGREWMSDRAVWLKAKAAWEEFRACRALKVDKTRRRRLGALRSTLEGYFSCTNS